MGNVSKTIIFMSHLKLHHFYYQQTRYCNHKRTSRYTVHTFICSYATHILRHTDKSLLEISDYYSNKAVTTVASFLYPSQYSYVPHEAYNTFLR